MWFGFVSSFFWCIPPDGRVKDVTVGSHWTYPLGFWNVFRFIFKICCLFHCLCLQAWEISHFLRENQIVNVNHLISKSFILSHLKVLTSQSSYHLLTEERIDGYTLLTDGYSHNLKPHQTSNCTSFPPLMPSIRKADRACSRWEGERGQSPTLRAMSCWLYLQRKKAVSWDTLLSKWALYINRRDR